MELGNYTYTNGNSQFSYYWQCYYKGTDLKTNRTYQERPVVFSYGGIELLRVGETFHSRTRKAFP